MSFPETVANRMLDDLGINGPKQLRLLTEIAFARGAIIREVNMQGAEARLSLMAGEAVISLSKSISNDHRKKFSIAHELGHLEMHRAETDLVICDKGDIGYFASKGIPSREDEANQFASFLLLPTRFVQSQFAEAEPSFDVIADVANQFDVSLTSTALRYLSFTDEPLAVVYSEDSYIRWFQATPSFLELGIFVEVKAKLSNRTKASTLFRQTELPTSWTHVPASSWLREGGYMHDAVISEWSIGMPKYDAVLSLLWVDEIIDEDDW